MNQFQILESSASGDKTFGLKITSTNGDVFTFENISHNRSDVERLNAQMSGADISSVHFRDIVCDFIVLLAAEKIALISR